jgi:hypothetical protein
MARPTIPITSTKLSKNDWQARKTPGLSRKRTRDRKIVPDQTEEIFR